MSFSRNEDTPNMFRARKPSITRAKHDKTNPALFPDVQAQVPHAIVPDLAPTTRDASRRPALAQQPETPPPKTCKQGTAKEIPPLMAIPAITANPVEDVHDWERTLQYRPFFAEEFEEDLYREVREDRKVEMGNDPLIQHILDMFPETPDRN